MKKGKKGNKQKMIKVCLNKKRQRKKLKEKRAEQEAIEERDRREEMEMKKRVAEKYWKEEEDRRKQVEETADKRVHQTSEAWRKRGIFDRLLNKAPSSDW